MIPPEPDPPEPGPDPPEPEPSVTYKLTASLLYITSPSGLPCTLTLSYREQADSAWVVCDSASFNSKASSATDTIVLENIPEGCHSVKLAVSTSSSSYVVDIKTHNSSDWSTYITYGSGNDGWDQDYQSDVDIRIERDD